MKIIRIIIQTAFVVLLINSLLIAQTTCASLLKNIGFEKTSGNIKFLTKLNSNTALFFAEDQYYGFELWRTDGTTDGTKMVKDITSGTADTKMDVDNSLNKPVVLNGIMYFEIGDGIHGFEVWRSNGTEQGTFMLKDLNDTNPNLASQNRSFIIFKNEVYFWEYSLEVLGRPIRRMFRLFKTKGTPETTILVGQIEGENYSRARKIIEFNNNLYFPVKIDLEKEEIFKIGSSENLLTTGIDFVKISDLGVANGSLYFTSSKGLYKSDGTTAGTVLIREKGEVFSVVGNESDGPFWGDGKIVYFLIRSGFLWRTDGTMMGTYALTKNGSGLYQSWDQKVPNVFLYKNALHFVDRGLSNSNNPKIWKTTGTIEGTVPVVDIALESNINSEIRLLTEIDGFLYFAGKVSPTTNENISRLGIWRTDGTQVNTLTVCPLGINLTCQPINPTLQDYGFIALGQDLLFLATSSAINDNNDTELYRTKITPRDCKNLAVAMQGADTFCKGASTVLTAASTGGNTPVSFVWTRDGVEVSKASSLTVTQAGTYRVQATDAQGCSVSDTKVITETSALPVSITGNNTFCAGSSTTLTASVSGGTTPFTYQWKQATTNVGTNSNIYAATTASSYGVEVSDSKGCKGISSSFAVTQRAAPATPTVTADKPAIVTGETATLRTTVAAGVSVQWLLNDAPISGATQTTYTATQAGTYGVRATNSDGCSATSQPVAISLITAIEVLQPETDIQAVVSPNPGSGLFDVRLNSPRNKPLRVLLTVNDLAGKGLYQKQIEINGSHTERIDLSQQPVGLYLLNAAIENQQIQLRLIRQ